MHRVVKHTQDEVKEYLKTLDIELLDIYKSLKTPIKVMCLKDNYIWMARYGNILHRGSRCPRCSNCEKYTNGNFDEKIKGRPILRIGDYVKAHTKIEFKCLDCQHVWRAKPYKILDGRGCPRCNGGSNDSCGSITIEEVDRRLNSKNLERLGEYISYANPVKVKCKIDGHIFDEYPQRLFDNKIPCPICPHSYRKSEETEKLIKDKNPNIEKVGEIKLARDRIKWRCKIDGEVFEQSPIGILYHGYGCPFCRKKGETEVKNILEGIPNKEFYKYQKTIYYSDTTRYIVDFFMRKNNKDYIIERNGEQHYHPIRFGGMSYAKAEKCFMKQQERDMNIKKYCDNNNITLIIIPYWYKNDDIINSIKELM